MKIRTRFWDSPDSTTAIQFRTDVKPNVWMHTNMGWVYIGNTPEDETEAENFAIVIADGYDLEERDTDFAEYMLG